MGRVRSGGQCVVVTGSNPAAGAECSDTVPAGEFWVIKSILLQLVTDATVITRRVHVTLDDGTTAFTRKPSNASQAASLTQNYAIGGNNPASAVIATYCSDPLPEFGLPAGSRIKTVTDNLQAGDNYAAPVYYVEKYSDG
jgi:hypothetical protein